MNRKKFLQLSCSSAMAGMALASFPKVVLGKTDPTLDDYWGDWEKPYKINIRLYSEGIKDYMQAVNYRSVKVSIGKNKPAIDSDEEVFDPYVIASYTLSEKPRLVNSEKNLYHAVARLENIDSYKLYHVDVNQELFLRISYGEDSSTLKTTFSGVDTELESNSTFLCSACLQARGMPHDCRELQRLRTFRNEYALKSSEGRKLIREYAVVGPRLVDIIENASNRTELYKSVYDSLVIPAIALIDEGRKETAMLFYKEYVEGLYKKLTASH